MHIDEKIFKSYDIRGIYPTQINEEVAVPIAKALFKFFSEKSGKPNPSIVVGRDMRLSSPQLHKIITQTFKECGATVIDIGLASTPTLYFTVFNHKYDAGIEISASHNPKEYNGCKIVMYQESGLLKVGKVTGMEDVKKMSIDGVDITPSDQGQIIEKSDAVEEELENALQVAGNPSLQSFRIVADPANAMGAIYLEAAFKKIPGELIKMNFELDGSFPVHQPDPAQKENLVDLQKKVIEEKADIGLAPDGDGDRMFIIDETGAIVLPSVMTGIIAKELLAQHPGSKVLFDVKYTINASKAVEKLGGVPHVTKTGHAFITQEMGKTGGIFASEQSAHYYYKAAGNVESQLITLLLVLKIMSESGKKLSELAEEYKVSHESGEFNFEVENAAEIIEAIKQQYHHGDISELDGVAIDFLDWRLSLRSSNTEPLLRLNMEHMDKDQLETKRQEVVDLIHKHAKFPEKSSASH